jgi:hypothetical protein
MRGHRIWLTLAALPACMAMAPIDSSIAPASTPPVPPPPLTYGVPAPRAPFVSRPLAKGAHSGKKQLIYSQYAVNPDCSIVHYPDVSLLGLPRNGRVFLKRGDLYPSFAKENVRSVCNTTKVGGILVYYQSNDDFKGQDDFSLRVLSTNGDMKDYDFAVTVF